MFRSLAQDQNERAICVVLSGTGSDGTLGARAVKGEGGLAVVQEPESADHGSMPRNAISTGLVDYVLPPEEMPAQLISYVAVVDEGAVSLEKPFTQEQLAQKVREALEQRGPAASAWPACYPLASSFS